MITITARSVTIVWLGVGLFPKIKAVDIYLPFSYVTIRWGVIK